MTAHPQDVSDPTGAERQPATASAPVAIEAVLIDLDGTLLDSIPDLSDAANAMRVELGMPELPVADITTFVGKGVEHLVRRTLVGNLVDPDPAPALFAQARDIFFRHYHVFNGRRATHYPGVIEGLQAMRAQGLRLAVVTNKPEQFTLPLLERSGLAGYFEAVVSGDTCARKKPDPMPMAHGCALLGVAPGHALAIGDSGNDSASAQGAGMRVLVVPYGYNEGHDVRTLKVDGIVSTLLDASHWVARTNAACR